MGLPPLAPFVYLGQYRLRCHVTVCRVWSLTLYDYIIVMIYFWICLCPFSGFLHHDKMYLSPYTLYLSFVKDNFNKIYNQHVQACLPHLAPQCGLRYISKLSTHYIVDTTFQWCYECPMTVVLSYYVVVTRISFDCSFIP